MTLHEAIKAHLDSQSAPINALTRVFPAMIQKVDSSQYPFAVVRRVSGSSNGSHDNRGLNSVRISITVYDNDTSRCEKIIAAIGATFYGFSGLLGGSGGVRCSFGKLAGPRSVTDDVTRSIGQQLDILGLVDEDTIS